MVQLIDAAAPVVTTMTIRLRTERALRTSLFVALCAVLMFGPLALGAVDVWSTALFETGAAAVLLIWMAWQLALPDIRIHRSPLFPPMLAFIGLVLAQIEFHRTAYLHDSLSELWLYIAYGILTFVTVQLIRSGDVASGENFIFLFADCLAAFGVIYAIFAVLQGFSAPGKIYWLIKPQVGNSYGTYVNHNHYAGLMELLLPLALGLSFTDSVQGAKRVLLVFGAILMAASVFLCQSRGGMFAVVVEIVFLAIIWTPQLSRRKSAAVFVLFSLVTASFLAWVAPQQVGSRIIDTHDPARWLIHRDSLRMFAAHPFLGSGFGAFATAFPHYRSFYDGFFVNYAHDDYLQLLLECGLAGFAVGLWFLIVLYRVGLRNLRLPKLSKAAMIRASALAGCTGLLAHSFVDFNLHIPANAAIYFVLCAIATSSSRVGIKAITAGKGSRSSFLSS